MVAPGSRDPLAGGPVSTAGTEQIEAQIAALGEGTPEYYEALAFYLITLARAQWRAADRARAAQKTRRRRGEDALRRFAESEMVR